MLTINNLYSILDEYAPFEISKKAIEQGSHDNSGIIVNCHQNINRMLFSLDLSIEAVNRAKRLKCDTIITHHPAIFYPISQIDISDPSTAPICLAVKNDINVISMHLNLDQTEGGIDEWLAKALGATSAKIIEVQSENIGYGREFCLNKTDVKTFVNSLKVALNTKRVVVYGGLNQQFNKVASFCGGGASHAYKVVTSGKCDAQVIVTSDVAHHVIKEFVEMGKILVIPTHYSAENFGFKKFYQAISQKLDSVELEYFEDKRFL